MERRQLLCVHYGIFYSIYTFFILFLVFLWDIILTNEKGSASFNQNELSLFNSGFDIFYNGTVYFSRDITSQVQCPMKLKQFPHDVQICSMRFGSYLRIAEEVTLGIALIKNENVLRSSNFDVVDITAEVKLEKFDVLNVSVAEIVFVLQRQIQGYIYQVIITARSWKRFFQLNLSIRIKIKQIRHHFECVPPIAESYFHFTKHVSMLAFLLVESAIMTMTGVTPLTIICIRVFSTSDSSDVLLVSKVRNFNISRERMRERMHESSHWLREVTWHESR